MKPAPFEALPTAPGAYRWIYADAACGDYTAVAIFMIGSLFSSRYVVAAGRGASPVAHSAINFALYKNGVRVAWVLSEYPAAHVRRIPGIGTVLRIGRSRLIWRANGEVTIRVAEHTAQLRSRVLHARLELSPRTAPMHELPLGDGHVWQPLAVRADARLSVRGHQGPLRSEGHGYLDTNHGPAPLGVTLPGWRWRRTHTAERTEVLYELPDGEAWQVSGVSDVTTACRIRVGETSMRSTHWGLKVPRAFELGEDLHAPARLLESSPFYARMEARAAGVHALGEVADFRRFRSPFVRWMADFRTRVEEVP